MTKSVLLYMGLTFASPFTEKAAFAQMHNAVNADPELYSPQATAPVLPSGKIADTGNGIVGQRQTRERSPSAPPLDRIDSRVASRVQNRIRNRIDADYDPQANAASPFRNADDQVRTAGRRRGP